MCSGNDGLGSRDGPWDARFRGAEEYYLDRLRHACAGIIGQPYRGVTQLEAFIDRLAEIAEAIVKGPSAFCTDKKTKIWLLQAY